MLRVFCIILFIAIPAPDVASQAQVRATSTYQVSVDGFRLQFEDLISADKSGDQAAFRERLDVFAIPNVNEWIAAYFSPADVPKLQGDYPLSFAGFQEKLTSVVERAANLSGRGATIWPSEPSTPPSATLAEQNLPSPV